MLRKVVFIVFCSLFYNNVSFAACSGTVSDDITGLIECDNNDTYVVDKDVSITSNGNNMIDVAGHTGVTITNNGRIDSSKHRTITFQYGGNNTLINNGTIEAASTAVFLKNHDGDITITNTGTINSTQHGTINNYGNGVSGDITITNSGTIKGEGSAHPSTGHNPRWAGVIELEGCTSSSAGCEDYDTTGSYTITNSGTIEQENSPYSAIKVGNHLGATIINTGTIIGGPEDTSNLLISGSTPQIGMDIVVMKCTTTTKHDNCGNPSSGGDATTTIEIGDGAVFTNGIDLNGTKANFVIGSNIKRDYSIRIFDYVQEGSDNLIITNNSDGTTYSLSAETLKFSNGTTNAYGHIHQSRHAGTAIEVQQRTGQGDQDADNNETAEYYNAGTDGVLTILGEKLEVEKNNQKYRAENTLTKLRSLFSASNYVGGKRPDYCTTIDPKKVDSELDVRCNKRFVKIFHSYQTREGVYDGTSSGILGMLSPIKWKEFPLVSNIFVGYSNQEGDFNNGEFLGGDNYVLGLKNTYENKGFIASLTPMIGLNDLSVIDYDTDKVQTVSNNFLSEFAAVNGKIIKEIVTGKDRSLNISVETTYGLQKFPDYISTFTDGDLSVDESIEELLSGGFEVSYVEGLPGSFIIKPYFGANKNKNLSNQTKITARGKNSNVSPIRETWSGYYAGVSLTKEAKGIDFDLNLMYGNEDGLINQIAAVSLTKSFGKAKKETISLEPVPDLPKVDESLTAQDYNKSFKELEIVRDLNKKLKIENEKLKAQNEKLKLLAKKTLEENEISKKMIIELIKENEKVKLENQIFKNRILENENKELIEQLEGSNAGNKPSGIFLLMFGTIFAIGVLGSAKIITLSTASIYNRIMYRPVRA